jgi:HSP20 family protein
MAMSRASSSFHFAQRANARGPDQEPHWVPNTDAYATDDGLVITVELAGMRREDLELTVEGNSLRIAGQRPDVGRPPGCRFLVMEINYGPFESVIELPAGFDLSRAKAAYQNGFLRVDAPVLARAVTGSIPLEISES